jgi:hypothetical protein
MSPRTPAWQHAANGAALLAILAVSAVVMHSAPDRDLQQSPISVPGSMGQPVSGRNIRATVHSVAATESVTAGNGWAGTTAGVWIVVDVSVEAVVDDVGAVLGTAVLRVGDTTFSASTRPGRATVAGVGLATGIPLTGPLLFEVPDALRSSEAATTATLELATNSDPRVDSLLVVPVGFGDLAVEESLDLDVPEWGSP